MALIRSQRSKTWKSRVSSSHSIDKNIIWRYVWSPSGVMKRDKLRNLLVLWWLSENHLYLFLVGGLEHDFYFPIQMGMSSSQLTNSYFSGLKLNHQPDFHSVSSSQPCWHRRVHLCRPGFTTFSTFAVEAVHLMRRALGRGPLGDGWGSGKQLRSWVLRNLIFTKFFDG